MKNSIIYSLLFCTIWANADAATFTLHSKTGKTTLADADVFGIEDSAAAWSVKKVAASDLKKYIFGEGPTFTVTPPLNLNETTGVLSITADSYQAYDADLTAWAAITPATGTINTTGAVQGKVPFNSYAAATTLTATTHNSSIVQMTVADEVTLWDCEAAANVGDTVMLWARDAEKIEVVPASGDHFVLFNGTALTADYELDMAATAGTKLTLMCTADDTWSVYSETAASTDGGAAD